MKIKRILFEDLRERKRKGEKLTEKQEMFCSFIYNQEEFDAGLNGDR